MKKASLIEKYKNEIVPKMKEKFKYSNDLAVPKIEKIVVNVGVGRMSQQGNFNDKILPEIIKDISEITGQKPSPRATKKSIAGFKTRAGQTVGLKVTLRGNRMYDFLDKVINIVFPRVKDFRGVDLKNVDQKGNLSVGFKEHVVFPEVNTELLKIDFGMEISIVSSAKSREEALELYHLFGFPFKK